MAKLEMRMLGVGSGLEQLKLWLNSGAKLNYKGIIENITDLASDHVDDWESGFIDSVENQLLEERELTKKQKDFLKRAERYQQHKNQFYPDNNKEEF